MLNYFMHKQTTCEVMRQRSEELKSVVSWMRHCFHSLFMACVVGSRVLLCCLPTSASEVSEKSGSGTLLQCVTQETS